VSKEATEDWQRCARCNVRWPVHPDFALRGIPVECPACHLEAPYDPFTLIDRAAGEADT
jgi:hypothetical protein